MFRSFSAQSRATIRTVLTWIFLAVLAGIIGNRADDLAVDALPSLGGAVIVPIWLPVLLVALGVFAIVFQIILMRRYGHTSRVAAQIVALDDTVLRLLPELATTNGEAAKQKLLTALFRDTVRVFAGEVARGSVLLPDPNDPAYLVPWFHYGMPPESVALMRFYIGPDINQRPGIAGIVFQKNTLKVVHFSEHNGTWTSDEPEYVILDSERPFPRYRSFVAVPIPDEHGVLGVLCLDSMQLHIFDSPNVQAFLIAVSGRISSVVLTAKRLNSTPISPIHE